MEFLWSNFENMENTQKIKNKTNVSILFANISATKAPIFIKFESFIHEIVKNYQMIFRKDPCTNTHT